MAFDDLAEIDEGEVAVLVDHRVERIDLAEHADDFQLLLMQRVADQIALDGERILHKACGMEGADRLVAGNAGSNDLTAAGPAGVPTFAREVAPILYASCVGCHRPGEIAPMPLVSYEDVRPWAKSIRAKVASREMPPWGADPRHGEFSNDTRLKQSEIDTIVAWVDGGAKEGDPLTDQQHEMLARTMERYTREGRAPSRQLEAVFAKFREWMLAIYRRVRDLDVPINDEIRGVLDRMLAAAEDIAEYRGDREAPRRAGRQPAGPRP